VDGRTTSRVRDVEGHRITRVDRIVEGSQPAAGAGERSRGRPDVRRHAVPVDQPGTSKSEATRVLGKWLSHVIAQNPGSFLLMAPDELISNRLDDVFATTDRRWLAGGDDDHEHLA
jgi:xylulose-5-phosphate/fructose-6-phosphate phosphoketolase